MGSFPALIIKTITVSLINSDRLSVFRAVEYSCYGLIMSASPYCLSESNLVQVSF